MDISQLRTFVAVAREGSVARASDKLHLSQPEVSAQIRVIEETLGLALFERHGTGLTSEGERLLVKAEDILAAHQSLLDEARRLQGSVGGRFRLGAGGSSIMAAVGRLVTILGERYREVGIEVENGTSLEILTRIRNGTLDAGFYNEAGDVDAAVTAIELARFGICVVAPPGLVDTSRGFAWPSLAQHTWIYPTSSPCCGKSAENIFKLHQFRPVRILNIDREPMTRTLVAGGGGIGILHADSAAEAKLRGEIEILHEAPDAVRALFAHLSSRARDPLVSAASAIVRTGH